MDWQAALRARLIAAAPVTALVGTRVHWIERPQGGALPAITLQSITEFREQHFRGFHGLQRARVQVDVWANSYSDARKLMDAAIDAVSPASQSNGVMFSRGFLDGIRDLGERAGDRLIYRKSADLIIHHAVL